MSLVPRAIEVDLLELFSLLAKALVTSEAFAFKSKALVTSTEFDFKFKAVCVAEDIGLLASLVLSMLLSPTMLLSSPPTVPVNVGLFIGAFSAKLFVTSEAFAFKPSEVDTSAVFALRFKAVWVALEMGLLASLVLSMLLSPTMLLSSPPTVPVNVGLFIGAFSAKLLVTSEVFAFKPREVDTSAAFAFRFKALLTSAEFAFRPKALVTSAELAFRANPGTVGEAAVPPKSPVNWILPLVFASASGAPEATCASTYVLTAF
jgi:hypothetical protein